MSKWVSTAVNVGPTLFAAEVRGHRLFGDVPEALGGHDTAMIPPEGLLAVLANCMGMEIALACRAHDLPYAGMKLTAEAEWDEKEHFLHDFRLTVQMPEKLDDHARRVVEAGAKMCTIRNTLQRGAQVALAIED